MVTPNSQILWDFDHESIRGICRWPGVIALVIDGEEIAYVEAKNTRAQRL